MYLIERTNLEGTTLAFGKSSLQSTNMNVPRETRTSSSFCFVSSKILHLWFNRCRIFVKYVTDGVMGEEQKKVVEALGKV